ncbi:TetR family transcriptional regulator [Mycobacterium alsense]|uniref:TetR family transcriptional regulator n=1 Tax=Mycobacterium alsense TaxID=324058 RepID=A0ABX3RCH6_9MYCO|nr:TetR family transcriptional regulator [Mycobacterium alsense]
MEVVISGVDSIGSRQARILDAALEIFSAHGTSDATLQMVAESAGVSVGLVQHHFRTKDGLIEAVGAHALGVVATTMSAPLPQSGVDAVLEVGRRVSLLLADHTSALDYLARLVVDGTPLGAAFFDAMVANGIAQWQHLAESGSTADGLDLVWAALNPLILILGGIVCRRQLDRHLPEPLTSPTQLQRWQDAVNALIRSGQLRP